MSRVLPQVDQLAVLSQSDVFLSHCGMNSVSESLYLGVPLVLFPQQEEQGMVARRVQELGAGVPLPAPTPAAIHQALSLVLADPAFQHSAQHISEGFRAAAATGGERIRFWKRPWAVLPCPEHLSGGAERKTAA